MIGTTDIEVGEIVYQVTTFNAVKGLTILQKLLKVIGPSMGELISDGQEDEEGGFVLQVGDLAKVVDLFVQNLDQVDAASLIEDMFKSVTIGGQPVMFSQHFAGNYGHLVAVLGKIITENYSSFFDGSGLGGLAQALPIQPSQPE